MNYFSVLASLLFIRHDYMQAPQTRLFYRMVFFLVKMPFLWARSRVSEKVYIKLNSGWWRLHQVVYDLLFRPTLYLPVDFDTSTKQGQR